MLIPGFDGDFANFNNLCERVKLPAVAVPPGIGHVDENITEMGHRLATVYHYKLLLSLLYHSYK